MFFILIKNIFFYILLKNFYNLEIKILIKSLCAMFLKSTKVENFLFRKCVRFSDF